MHAQLGHRAEDGEAPAAGAEGRQGVDGGGHRRGVGVVGVVQHDQAGGGPAELHPPRRADRSGQAGHGGVEADPDDAGHGHRQGGVAGLVGAPHREGGTSIAPQGVSRWNDGRRSSSSCTPLTRTSASAATRR